MNERIQKQINTLKEMRDNYEKHAYDLHDRIVALEYGISALEVIGESSGDVDEILHNAGRTK